MTDRPPVADETAAWDSPDWWSDVSAWIATQATAARIVDVGPIRPLRSLDRSVVATVDTSQGPLFFKATRLRREPQVTALLSRDYPAHFPRVVALDVDRGWILMRKVCGAPLSASNDLRAWTQALHVLARIQCDYAGRVDELLDLGCPRRTVAWVRTELRRSLPRLLTRPDIVAVLSPGELDALTDSIPGWQALCDSGLPSDLPAASLDHGDLHADNILMSETGAVFLDWEAAAVGHPFFAPHVLFGYINGVFPQLRGAETILRDAYLRPWLQWCSLPTLLAAFESIRPIASLNYALGLALGSATQRAPLPAHARKVTSTIAFCLRAALGSAPDSGRARSTG